MTTLRDWMDALGDMWGAIDGGDGGYVHAYRQDDFPETISVFPSALSYITATKLSYSAGGPCFDFYEGLTEFHLTESTNKTLIPYAEAFIERIRNAAAGNMALGGLANYFLLESVRGPLKLQYGSEEPHLGLIVTWRVKLETSGDFTVSA